MAEDGFEFATGDVVGGAMVMTRGALPAISGNTSLYIGTPFAPALEGIGNRSSLMVRLARQAGDTKLRFSHRVGCRPRQAPVAVLRFGLRRRIAGPVDQPERDCSRGTRC